MPSNSNMGLGWNAIASGAQDGLEALLTRRLKAAENERRNQELLDQQARFGQEMGLRERAFQSESQQRAATLEETRRHNTEVEDYQRSEREAHARLYDQQDKDREEAARVKAEQRAYRTALLNDPTLPSYIKQALKVAGPDGAIPAAMLQDPNLAYNHQVALAKLQHRLNLEDKTADDPTLPREAQDFLTGIANHHDDVSGAYGELDDNLKALRARFPNMSTAKARDFVQGFFNLPKGYSERNIPGMGSIGAALSGGEEAPQARPSAPAPRPQSRIKSITQVK